MATTKKALEKMTSGFSDELRGDLHDRIEKEKLNLIDALFQLAKGAWTEQKGLDDKGQPYTMKIYQKPPDKEVAQYLLNQVIGKPKENVTIQGKVNFIMDE